MRNGSTANRNTIEKRLAYSFSQFPYLMEMDNCSRKPRRNDVICMIKRVRYVGCTHRNKSIQDSMSLRSSATQVSVPVLHQESTFLAEARHNLQHNCSSWSLEMKPISKIKQCNAQFVLTMLEGPSAARYLIAFY